MKGIAYNKIRCYKPVCRNGRRCGLKIRWWQHRVGSSPTTGTTSRRAFWFAAFFVKKAASRYRLPLLFRKKAHSRRRFGCKRPHNVFGSLFFDIAPSAQPKSLPLLRLRANPIKSLAPKRSGNFPLENGRFFLYFSLFSHSDVCYADRGENAACRAQNSC